MSDFKSRVIIGNIVLYPEIIKRYLIKSTYYLSYDPKVASLSLCANHGFGGQTLLKIGQVSYESVVKFAEGLGLKGDGEYSLLWRKWNPVLLLYHDDSDDAETLRVEMLKLGIPHIVNKGELGIVTQSGRIGPPLWSLDGMLREVRETAERNREELATIP